MCDNEVQHTSVHLKESATRSDSRHRYRSKWAPWYKMIDKSLSVNSHVNAKHYAPNYGKRQKYLAMLLSFLPSLCKKTPKTPQKRPKKNQKKGRAQKIRFENPKTAHRTKRQPDPVAHIRHFLGASSISIAPFHGIQELEP